jgi:hypothetical protein
MILETLFLTRLKFSIHPNTGKPSNKVQKLLIKINYIFLVDLEFFFLFDLELFHYFFQLCLGCFVYLV